MNQSLLDSGSAYAVVFLVLATALLVTGRRSRRVRALTTLSAASLRRDRLRHLLPLATIAFLGTAAGIANSASTAAVEPLERVLSQMGADEYVAVVQHESFVLNNHGGIPWTAVGMLDDVGLDPLPVTIALGSLSDEAGELLAPSAAVVLVPDALGSAPASMTASSSCDDIPVAVGTESGLRIGDALTVDGRRATVAALEPINGGLGRIVVLGTHERLGACAFPEEIVSLVLVREEAATAVGELLSRAGVQHEFVSTKHLVETYDEFWVGTVAPPQMNLFFQVFLVASIGSVYVSRTRSLQLQEIRASLSSRGVSRSSLAAITALGTAYDTAIASIIAVVPFAVLTAVTNATQIGLELPVSLESFGAGLLAGHVVVGIGWLFGDVPVLRNLDVGAELRKVL